MLLHCFLSFVIFVTFLSPFYLIYSPTITLLMIVFFPFEVLRKLREVPKMKWYVAHLEQEGLQELELAMVGTSASWLVDLV